MSGLNLAPALAALPQTQMVLLERGSGVYVKGRFQRGIVSKEIPFRGVVQPFPEKKLRHFPHGEEAHGAQLIQTTRKLDTTNRELGTQADHITIDGHEGILFKIASVGNWKGVAGFYRYAAVMERPA